VIVILVCVKAFIMDVSSVYFLIFKGTDGARHDLLCESDGLSSSIIIIGMCVSMKLSWLGSYSYKFLFLYIV
jgi:hypothetical protein